MKYYNNLYLLPILALSLFLRCSSGTDKKGEESKLPSHVEIKHTHGKYQFYVNDQPYELKGVGYGSRNGSYLDILAQSGGNTIRTWGTRNGKQLLDSAAKYDIMVAMGLGMGQQLHGFDYEDEKAVSDQFNRIKKEVLEFKDHPNILCWVILETSKAYPG